MIVTKTSIPYLPQGAVILSKTTKAVGNPFRKKLNPNYPLYATVSSDGKGISGSTYDAVSVSVFVDESLKANIGLDGLSISGKAEAGSTIRVEVS